MSEQPPPSKRIRLYKDDLRHFTKEDLIARLLEQETYITTLEDMLHDSDKLGFANEIASLRHNEAQLKNNLNEVKKRENVMVLKLTAKEQEVNDFRSHIQMLKTSSTPSVTQLKSLLLDPAVNLMFQRMKTEVKDAKKKEKEAQEDLAAWKFTPDSQTGKRLMARCRSLLQENESIGKMIASGRVAKIEGELALQRRLVDEMKSGQAELDVFIAELDEDVEGMQSTIYLLQQQLREARAQTAQLKSENEDLKSSSSSSGKVANDANHSNNNNKVDDDDRDDSFVVAAKKEEKVEKVEETTMNKESVGDKTDEAAGFNDAAATIDDDDADLKPSLDESRQNSNNLSADGGRATQDENVFTLTLKDSERQELDEEFGADNYDEEEGDEKLEPRTNGKISTTYAAAAAKTNAATTSGVGKNKHHHHDSNNVYSNGSVSKRPYVPDDDDDDGGREDNGDDKKEKREEKTNAASGQVKDAAPTASASRSRSSAASPAKKARGGSGGGGRASRARRVSVGGDTTEDDQEGNDHEKGVNAVATKGTGRSPRAATRAGSGARATRGSTVSNGDATENGMDCD